MKVLQMTWGYSMTINDFFKVERETEKTATVRRLKSKHVRQAGYLAGYETYSEEYYEQDTKEYRVQKKNGEYRGSVFLNSGTRTLHVVEPNQEFYYNHCD